MTNNEDVALCGSCNKLVKNTDKAFLCDGICEIWYHAKCVKINNDMFEKCCLVSKHMKWICEPCELRLSTMRKHTVSVEDYFNLNELVGNLMGLVKTVINDNTTINNKLEFVCSAINNGSSPTCHRPTTILQPTVEYEDVSNVTIPQPYAGTGTFSEALKNPSDKIPRPYMIGSVSTNNTVTIDHVHTELDNLSKVPNPEQETFSMNNDSSDSGGEWRLAGKRGKPRHTSHSVNKTYRPKHQEGSVPLVKHPNNKFVLGSCEESTNLKTVDRRDFLFVSRISPEYETDDMLNFLTEVRKCTNITVEKLTSRYPEAYSSFKVGFPSSFFKNAFSADFWPKGTFVNRFFVKKVNLNYKNKDNKVNK